MILHSFYFISNMLTYMTITDEINQRMSLKHINFMRMEIFYLESSPQLVHEIYEIDHNLKVYLKI